MRVSVVPPSVISFSLPLVSPESRRGDPPTTLLSLSFARNPPTFPPSNKTKSFPPLCGPSHSFFSRLRAFFCFHQPHQIPPFSIVSLFFNSNGDAIPRSPPVSSLRLLTQTLSPPTEASNVSSSLIQQRERSSQHRILRIIIERPYRILSLTHSLSLLSSADRWPEPPTP